MQRGTFRCVSSQKEEGEPANLVQWLQLKLESIDPVQAVLHRIVHAGAVSEGAYLCDESCYQQISHWATLAPLHNPSALQAIEMIMACFPGLSQYAVFDSGLYMQLPEVARVYPVPANLLDAWPIQRYGFHGLAHRSMWRQLTARLQQQRIITLQLGSGCSLTAWQQGQVVDTSMGFTPLEGVMMASRSGDIDAGLILHLLQNGYSVEQLQELLTKHSGLSGVSGLSADMRILLASNSDGAQLAIELYVYRIKKQLGAYMAVLGGVDVICFGGGIGENQPAIRQRILAGLQDFGIVVDDHKNEQLLYGAGDIHQAKSKVKLEVRLVDEAEEMVQQYLLTTAGLPQAVSPGPAIPVAPSPIQPTLF
jgi:acetate kinase